MKQHALFSFIIFTLLIFHHTHVFSADTSQVLDTLPTSEEKEDKIFTHVEIQPSTDTKKWMDHLKKKMPTAIEEAVKRKIPVGKYEVELRLIVEKNGEISKIEIEKDPGFRLAESSIEIVRSGPKWKAGEVCGRRVRTYKKQPFIYVVNE